MPRENNEPPLLLPAWQRTHPGARLTRPEDARFPVLVTMAQAQAAANFVVQEPAWLPADCTAGSGSLREEQPPGRPDNIDREALGQTPWSVANPCSLRTVFHGRERAFRIKQFLYDWAPPAADVAPLWDSPKLEPFECDGEVGWQGLDYKSAAGACISRERTQIEFSALEGEFSPTEISRILCSMRAADDSNAELVRRARFHDLSYWVRYRVSPYRVPYGLFQYSHKRQYAWSRALSSERLAATAAGCVRLPGGANIELDSAIAIEHAPANHREIEAIFRSQDTAALRFWCISINADSQWTIELPPAAEPRDCELREPRSLRGTSVWVAALTRRYGPWEAMWEEAGHRYAVWASSSADRAEENFLAFIESLSAERLSAFDEEGSRT